MGAEIKMRGIGKKLGVTIKNNTVVIAPEDRLGEELILHPIFADSFEFAVAGSVPVSLQC